MNTKRRILQNISSNGLKFVVLTGCSIVIFPMMINYLGNAYYGLWVLTVQFVGYSGVLDLGVGSALTRFIAKYKAANDYEEVNSTIVNGIVFFGVVGVLIAAVAFLMAPHLPHFFNLTAEESPVFVSLVILSGVNMAILFPTRVLGSIITACERIYATDFIKLFVTIIRTIIFVVLLTTGFGVVALMVVEVILTLAASICQYLYIRKEKLVKINFKLSLIEKNKFKEIYTHSVYFFIASVADQLKFYTDSIVITTFLSVSAVTPYMVGLKLYQLGGGFIRGFNTASSPIFSRYEGKVDPASIKRLLFMGTRYTSFVAVFIISVIFLFGRPIIELWVSPQYSDSYYVAAIFLLPGLFGMSQVVTVASLSATGKHRSYAYLNTFEGVSNLILSIILVKNYGIYGVALGTAIPAFIAKAIIQPVIVTKAHNLSIKEYFKQSLMLPFIVGGVFTITMKLGMGEFYPRSIYHLVALMFFAVILYFLFFLSAIFSVMPAESKKTFFTDLLGCVKQPSSMLAVLDFKI